MIESNIPNSRRTYGAHQPDQSRDCSRRRERDLRKDPSRQARKRSEGIGPPSRDVKELLSFYGSVGKSLDRKLYELIYIRVSLINGCRYCTQHHVTSSKRVGLTAEDWAALKAGDYSRFDNKARIALTYVEKLTRAPQSITDSDFAPLREQFSEPEIVDIHLLTGLANLTNRFTDPLGLELEFPEEKI